MVRTTKRDFKSPRVVKRTSLTKIRTASRTKAQTSSTSSTSTNSFANIKVVVRVRPPNAREQGENSRNVIQVVDDNMLIFDPKEESRGFFYQGVQQKHRDLLKKTNKNLQFMFDKVFNDSISNDSIFQDTTHSLIDSLMNGYNCSVFAYGATGAGKTHTMIGNNDSPGITFLTMVELFRRKTELSEERDFDLGITYLEVYNELVQDLLNPGPALYLREDSKYGVIVAGIKVHKIVNVDELFKLLEEGNKNRTQHPTDANAESSRSHAVFQVYIQMKFKATAEVRTAKLSMIDLAGSERGSATGCVGARFTEGANINKSLLALGNCINSLADGHRHIPYRDSKLTRLLKDSLGGNCRTIMIANVSPSSLSYEDTYNTLKYATRAKKIKSMLKKNVLDVELHVGNYVEMIAQLKKEVSSLKTKLNEEVNKNSNLELQIKKLKSEQIVSSTASIIQSNSNLNGTFVKPKQVIPEVIPDIIEDDVQLDESLKLEIERIFKQKSIMLERCHQIELSGLVSNLRRQMKEEADSRMSDICTNTPERKTDAHKRLGDIVDRFQRKEDALKEEINVIKLADNKYEKELKEILNKEPKLQEIYDLETQKYENLKYKYQIILYEKEKEILRDDNYTKNMLICKMANLVKIYHGYLNGHGFVTEEMQKDYEDLVKVYEGRKNIRWNDNIGTVDSGLSSSSSLECIEKENIQIVPEANSNTQLDSTFTLNESPKKKNCTGRLVSKVYKNIPNGTRVVLSPRFKDMNKKRMLPPSTTATVNRVPKNVSATTSKKPPFRT